MSPNLRSLVAKAYRLRQGRTFSSSSSSAPNPIENKGDISIYNWLFSRGFVTLTGFGVGKKRFLLYWRQCFQI
ncbi:hypothetical protein HA466_0056740 [Hirschfeldia incana]|nr:hypothetical protein HA466_0056740 [Hirschfeldia incana]